MDGKQTLHHPIAPVYDAHSRVLLLGSFPSPKSRAQGFYYMHPQNRFWRVLAALFEAEIPQDIPAKKQFLLANHIALWDVLARCDIRGAADGSIENPVPNNLNQILQKAGIRAVFTTGQKAFFLYEKHCRPKTGRAAICLPSTSSANCRLPYEGLLEAYQAAILPFLQG